MSKSTEDQIDSAAAELEEVRGKKLEAIKRSAEAQAALDAATARRAALVALALAGDEPKVADIAAVDAACAEAGLRLAFRRDVSALGDAAIESAKSRLDGEKVRYSQQLAVARQEAVNVALYANLPHQPTDADLLARQGLLAQVRAEAERAYKAAYEYWQGPPAFPTHTPRSRLIQEGLDWKAWDRWACAVEEGHPHGWQARAAVRQLRVAIAARDHFTAYSMFGLDDLISLHRQDYAALREKLPTFDGMVAPGVFAGLPAPRATAA